MGSTGDVSRVEVGSRVAVYSQLDRKYYPATVSRERPSKHLLFLEYDDGETEWLDLSKHKFRILPGGTRIRKDEILQDDDSSPSVGTASSSDSERDAPNPIGVKKGLFVPSSPQCTKKMRPSFTPPRGVNRVRKPLPPPRGVKGAVQQPKQDTNCTKDDHNAAHYTRTESETSDSEDKWQDDSTPCKLKNKVKDEEFIHGVDNETKLAIFTPSCFAAGANDEASEFAKVASFVERLVENAIKTDKDVHDEPIYPQKAKKVKDRDKRTMQDGCLRPLHSPKQNDNDSYARPTGRAPLGMRWSSERGVWVVAIANKKSTKSPKTNYPTHKKKTRPSPVEVKAKMPRLREQKYSIGTKVRKFFHGFGLFHGQVDSFNGSFYGITYEDGDREEVTERELATILLTPQLAAVEVGSRISIYWPSYRNYYEAVVTRERHKSSTPYYLEYDDGFCEWSDLTQYDFRILKGGTRRRRDDEVVQEDDSDIDDESVFSNSASAASFDEIENDSECGFE